MLEHSGDRQVTAWEPAGRAAVVPVSVGAPLLQEGVRPPESSPRTLEKIYDIEDDIRDRAAEEKRAIRQASSKPVHDELVAWCKAHQPHEPPSSPMGAAIRYLLNHQLALRRFLDGGVVPIDNGIVERLHVRTALTRKNFLFAGSDTGGERAAIAYTVLGCCELAEGRSACGTGMRFSTRRSPGARVSAWIASGFTAPVGWLPAEYAWNRPRPSCLSTDSAMMLLAELPVQRNSAL